MLTLDDLMFCLALVQGFLLALIMVSCLALYYDREREPEMFDNDPEFVRLMDETVLPPEEQEKED